VRPLVLVGAGGFAREVAHAVLDLNDDGAGWDLLGFLDDDPTRRGTAMDGIPVIGTTAELDRLGSPAVLVCTGSPADPGSRRRLVERLDLGADRFATLVHPAASVARATTLGPGTVVMAGAVSTANATIGAHVTIMAGTVVTHDDVLADYVIAAAGVRLGGGVQVDAGAYLGAGCLVRERLRVGTGALLGMGSVVLCDVPAGEVWAGVPARRLRVLRPAALERI
jgi:sugar O-acyltransferase (sialic acid O-acetyltransferase NeuD family)